VCQRLIPTSKPSGLLTRTATTESVSNAFMLAFMLSSYHRSRRLVQPNEAVAVKL
jgi:hypothetical protein